MVYEQGKKKCITPGGWEHCYDRKTLYIRAIKDKNTIEKDVISQKTGNLLRRTETTHKMKWVSIGTICPACLNIDYYPDWLESNKEEYDLQRKENENRKINPRLGL